MSLNSAGSFEQFDDRDLLITARSDREAFAELYRRHAGGILGYFSRALGRSDLAFDLTAETFAAALRSLPSYGPTAAPGRSWLYAIARNQLTDAVRRGKAEARARKRLGMQAVVFSDAGEPMVDRVIRNVDGRPAIELVASLPSDQRAAVAARFFQDRDYAEIATEMRCSEQVVRKRVSRGLATIRARLTTRNHGRAVRTDSPWP